MDSNYGFVIFPKFAIIVRLWYFTRYYWLMLVIVDVYIRCKL